MAGNEREADAAAASGGGRLARLHAPNMAEMVADAVRQRILAGELVSGEVLPSQETLAREFGTSTPTVREGLRILEGEGLVTVRRGRFGGAVVHAPAADTAAYMLGLVLQARDVRLAEVGRALRDIEPLCAGLCAERKDRRRTVVPKLREVIAAGAAPSVPLLEGIRLGRRFHEVLVANCGAQTYVVLLGALESIWSVHSEESAVHGRLSRSAPRRSYLEQRSSEHEELVDRIDAGDADGAVQLARRHLDSSTLYRAGRSEPTTVVQARLLARSMADARDARARE